MDCGLCPLTKYILRINRHGVLWTDSRAKNQNNSDATRSVMCVTLDFALGSKTTPSSQLSWPHVLARHVQFAGYKKKVSTQHFENKSWKIIASWLDFYFFGLFLVFSHPSTFVQDRRRHGRGVLQKQRSSPSYHHDINLKSVCVCSFVRVLLEYSNKTKRGENIFRTRDKSETKKKYDTPSCGLSSLTRTNRRAHHEITQQEK